MSSVNQSLRESEKPVVNEAVDRWALPDFKEVWRYRHLLVEMVIADLKARYKQTIMGLCWAVAAPLISMVVFTFVFGRLANVPSYGIPYPIFAFAALVPWTLFSKALASSSVSIVGGRNVVGKIYLPRILLPFSKSLIGVIDFFVALLILILMMALMGFGVDWRVITLPFFILLALITALGIGMILCSIHVHIRDVSQILPFAVQILLFLSPVAYPSKLIDPPWDLLYKLNPMATVCNGFRWALLGIDGILSPAGVLISTLAAVLLFVTGLVVFQRMQSRFPDYL